MQTKLSPEGLQGPLEMWRARGKSPGENVFSCFFCGQFFSFSNGKLEHLWNTEKSANEILFLVKCFSKIGFILSNARKYVIREFPELKNNSFAHCSQIQDALPIVQGLCYLWTGVVYVQKSTLFCLLQKMWFLLLFLPTAQMVKS